MHQQLKHPQRRRVLAAACALGAAAVVAPAGAFDWPFGLGKGERVRGSGRVRRDERALGGFTGLALALACSVEVQTGTVESVAIETDDNLLPLIETVVEDGVLKIRARRDKLLNPTQLKIVVRTRGLDRVALGGSGSIHADLLRGARVRVDLGGSGTVAADRIEGDAVSVSLGGSGSLKAGGGTAHNVALTVGGSGGVDLALLAADAASVTVAGSGNARLWVRNDLSVTIAGSGDIAYYGDPKLASSMLGSGAVRRLGPAPR